MFVLLSLPENSTSPGLAEKARSRCDTAVIPNKFRLVVESASPQSPYTRVFYTVPPVCLTQLSHCKHLLSDAVEMFSSTAIQCLLENHFEKNYHLCKDKYIIAART